MSSFLYILSEDDSDDEFYSKCIESMTGREFVLVKNILRTSGGLSAVRKVLPIFLKNIKNTKDESACFVIAIDNDRSQHHSGHETPYENSKIDKLPKKEKNKPCRFCEINRVLREAIPNKMCNESVAVPCEMLESWLLLIDLYNYSKQEDELPLFSRVQGLASKYYNSPEPQLKELVTSRRDALGYSKKEYYSYCAKRIDVESLSKISPSFALFKSAVEQWSF